jgi:hypothetical protein
MNELDYTIVAMQVLIAIISISIAIISMKNYSIFRNWRLLSLSISFFILSIPPFFSILSFLLSTVQFFLILYVASVLPFALLAVVYFDERMKQAINITQEQRVVGGSLVLADIILIVYILLYIFPGAGILGFWPSYNLYLIGFISANIGYLLVILIVISLFSYYQVKRTANTLVVMIGFICLLFSHGFGLLSYLYWTNIPVQGTPIGFGLVEKSLELAGYIAFLVALVRLKVVR